MTDSQTIVAASDVLIVDDDPPIRSLLGQIFRRLGMKEREARDGIEAIEAIELSVPRLMMLDLMMPRMNGWQVLETLKERNLIGQIPVIVLTAVGAQRTEGLTDLGVRAVLNKPFEIADLTETVKKILAEQN